MGIVQSVIDNRKHKREVKSSVQKQRLSNIAAGRVAEAQWNLESVKRSGWRAHWVTILFSVPLILAFIPAYVPALGAGFTVLAGMPIWYQAGVSAMIASAFGLQAISNNRMNNAYTLPAKVKEAAVVIHNEH